MIIISAMSQDRVIGSGDGMPWDVPEEYQHFLDTTRDQTLILGRRSFEIFGPTLTSRRCYVITRSGDSCVNAEPVGSLNEALRQAAQYDEQVYVAGGASIYEQAVPLAEEMLLSTIKGDYSGDAYFPEFDAADWKTLTHEDRGSYVFDHYARV